MARADGEAHRRLLALRAGKVRAGADVIQLFDSWVGALSPAGLRGVRAAVLGAHPRRRRLPDDPLRHRHGDAARADARRGRRRDRARLADPARLGLGAVGDDRGVQGNLDGALLLGPWERVEAATLDVLARAAGRPGHIFNLGHGVMPDTDPDVLGRLRAFVHEQTARHARARMSTAVVLMAYGSPDRLEDVPAYYADIRGGRPIKPELLEDLVERYRRLGIEDSNPLNEITEATRAALEAELGLPSSPACATGSRGSPTRSSRRSRRAPTRSSGSCSRRTTRRCRSAVPRAARGGRRRPRRAPLRRALGHEPGFVDAARRARSPGTTHRHVVFTAHSLPARILDEGDPYRDELLETSRLVAERAGPRVDVLVPERVADRASPGSARTSSST